MRVSHVALDDFRSYRHAVVEFTPGTTVLLGSNGQGKTNLVEAVSYLSAFSSHRVSAEQALVRLPLSPDEAQPGGAVVRVRLVTAGERETVIELEIVRGKANRAKVNRTQVRPREVLGLLKSVVFSPEDLQIVRGDPQVRRQFLDDLLIQQHPLIAQVKSDFDKVARQRAALMKSAQSQLRRGFTPDFSTVEVWDDTFAQLSAQLSLARVGLVEELRGPAAHAYEEIGGSPRKLDIEFLASQGNCPVGGDLATIAGELKEILASSRMKEAERGVNLFGAHRDDLKLTLGGMPVKGYASHGETWSVALSLRLGAFELLSRDGDTPILILDDVFAELDSSRRAGLTRMITEAEQVLITAAVADDVPQELHAQVHAVHWDPELGTVVGDE
ncbi:MAG: DNA replication/repair protein RecF [Actinomyces sp. oral taxon 181]|uniref:DNA replication/repair protein RecF n=1 Tax=Actinomyces sp. oral taxon 181 TaxID=712121 RepID=UPI0025C48DFE|nr:DNA replication/repair protein RecF [Actinomyces sp. oral taxon 181]MBS4796085.1 DNA replication/repair protein RecF [Actinomyces sp. oral taxon 181]